MWKLVLLGLSLLVISTPRALADPVFQVAQQRAPLLVPLNREGVRATSSNTSFIVAVPDSAGTVRVDTLDAGRRLAYESAPRAWRLPNSLIFPSSIWGRNETFTLYFGNPAGADTLIGSGFKLDLGAPFVGAVDSSAVGTHELSAIHMDSTSVYTLVETNQTKVNAREVPSGEAFVYAPWGTDDAAGSIVEAGGSGSGVVGTVIKAVDWQGYGMWLDRPSGTAGGYDGIYLDMSDDDGVAQETFGVKVDYSGTGDTVNGVYVARTTGSRSANNYGVRSQQGSSCTQTAGTNFAGYYYADVAATGAAFNVGVYAKADRNTLDIGVWSDGDILLDGILRYETPWSGIDTLATGLADTVTIAGFDSTAYIVLLTPTSDWLSSPWVEKRDGFFIVNSDSTETTATYDYMIVDRN